MTRGTETGTSAESAGESPEDAWAIARKRVDKKSKVARDCLAYLAVVTALFIFARPAAFWVALFWGISLAREVARLWVEPELRNRWVEREVRNQLDRTVTEERTQRTGQHSRNLEDLAAGVAHEIRNPISAAKSLVQQMGEDPGSGENVQYAEVALAELGRVERSISHLLRFAREPDLVFSEVSFEEVISSAIATLADRAKQLGIRVQTRIDGELMLRGDAEHLRRVVINLIANAVDAVAGHAEPEIQVHAGENLARTEIWLRVCDNGSGIPSEQLAQIWSPFYTSKSDGTGLGLAIAKKLVDGHAGSIQAGPQEAGGTEFLVTLPRSGPPTQETS